MPFLNEDVYSPNDADSSERPPSFRRFSMRREEGGWSPYSLSVTMTIVTEGRILGRLDETGHSTGNVTKPVSRTSEARTKRRQKVAAFGSNIASY